MLGTIEQKTSQAIFLDFFFFFFDLFVLLGGWESLDLIRTSASLKISVYCFPKHYLIKPIYTFSLFSLKKCRLTSTAGPHGKASECSLWQIYNRDYITCHSLPSEIVSGKQHTESKRRKTCALNWHISHINEGLFFPSSPVRNLRAC